jgi:hypothetical protein
MDIIEVLKKMPKLLQIVLSDSQIVFSDEKELICDSRRKLLQGTLNDLKVCINHLDELIDCQTAEQN